LGCSNTWLLARSLPPFTRETAYHIIYSTATREQTEATARTLELLYGAYSNRFGHLAGFQHAHPKLKVKLYKDREEFRWINPGLGWGEAFYREPYCRAYFSSSEITSSDRLTSSGSASNRDE